MVLFHLTEREYRKGVLTSNLLCTEYHLSVPSSQHCHNPAHVLLWARRHRFPTRQQVRDTSPPPLPLPVTKMVRSGWSTLFSIQEKTLMHGLRIWSWQTSSCCAPMAAGSLWRSMPGATWPKLPTTSWSPGKRRQPVLARCYVTSRYGPSRVSHHLVLTGAGYLELRAEQSFGVDICFLKTIIWSPEIVDQNMQV